jgi:hypothetical protein
MQNMDPKRDWVSQWGKQMGQRADWGKKLQRYFLHGVHSISLADLTFFLTLPCKNTVLA